MEARLPSWVVAWCARELGATPVEQLLSTSVMSDVVAVRLDDGRAVVIKRREDESGRASRCVDIQRALAEGGFPCARPVTPVTVAHGLAVHAEEWRPGGEIMRGDGLDIAARSAVLLADLMARLVLIDAIPPLPNAEWVRWDHDGPGVFPANERHDARAERVTLPGWIEETARRVRARLRQAELPCVLGHADWEAQNLRWRDTEAHAVHDWDSLAWLPEAAVAGAASGAFASAEVPTLAPLESSAAFLDAYERARGRAFTANEREVAWGAGIWPALHNARVEILHDLPRVASHALERQAAGRLALASA